MFRKCFYLPSGLIMLALVGSGTASADIISYDELAFTGPVTGTVFGSPNSVVVGPATSIFAPGYTFSGEFCEDRDCTGGAIGSPQDSLLRLTNLNLTCNNPDSCGAVDVIFEALGASVNGAPMPATPVSVNLSLDGSGSASGFVRICIASSTEFCTSNLVGPQSVSFGFSNSIGGNASTIVSAPSGFDVYGDLHIDGLGNGQSVILTNSLDLGVTSTVPEPATFGFVGSGLAALAWLARRRCGLQ